MILTGRKAAVSRALPAIALSLGASLSHQSADSPATTEELLKVRTL